MAKKKDTPLPIQLAIQGGGAKICALLAAMEVVQKLQRDKKLIVKRIAGTSAGAIVGALFAAGIDMAVVRERLRGVPLSKVPQMFPAPGLNLFTKLARGRPLWGTQFLVDELVRFLEKKARVVTFRELQEQYKTELLVVAADLTESGKIVYGALDDEGRAPNKKIIEAILDSCGLPYCFRTWNKSGSAVIVDGGICENLPSDELLPYEHQDGPVIGISFDTRRGRAPDNWKDFSIALLDTAMNNSMSRAKLRLGTGRVFSIPTEIGTFDFEKALTEGLADPEYDRVSSLASDFFNSLIDAQNKRTQTITREAWEEQNTLMMSTLGEVYKKQHEKSRLRYKHCSLVLEANSLEGDETVSDYISYRLKFETLDDPIYCHAVSLSETENHATFGQSDFYVLDPNGVKIDMRKVPIRDPEFSSEPRLLLFFLPPLKPKSGTYTMVVRDVIKDAVKPLREGRQDELVFAPLRASGIIDQIDLVLLWPKARGTAVMMPKQGEAAGRAMSSLELTNYPTPARFNAVGWTGQSLDSRQEFGVNLLFTKNEN